MFLFHRYNTNSLFILQPFPSRWLAEITSKKKWTSISKIYKVTFKSWVLEFPPWNTYLHWKENNQKLKRAQNPIGKENYKYMESTED